jgi:CHAT domain-containing protein
MQTLLGSIWHWPVVLAAALVAPQSVRAESWGEQVRNEIFCLRSAKEGDRASLHLPASTAYSSPESSKDRLLRYLLTLQSLAYFADRMGDPALRFAILGEVWTITKKDEVLPEILRLQIGRCNLALALASAAELENRRIMTVLSNLLEGAYRKAIIGPAAEDLPVVHALRELSLIAPTIVREALASTPSQSRQLLDAAKGLVSVTRLRAQVLKSKDPLRANRLLAAAAQASLALGEPGDAWALAKESSEAGRMSAMVEAHWRTFPVYFDLFRTSKGHDKAIEYAHRFAKEFNLPDQLADPELEYAIYVRLAETARVDGKREESAAWYKRAWVKLTTGGTPSIAQYRHAIVEARSAIVSGTDDALGNRRYLQYPALARRSYQNIYKPLAIKQRDLAQRIPLADSRVRLHFIDAIDHQIETLSWIYQAAPDLHAEIADLTFGLVQLRGFHGSLAATAYHLEEQLDIDSSFRNELRNRLSVQVMPGQYLRFLWRQLHAATPEAAEQVANTGDISGRLSSLYEDTTVKLSDFRAYVNSRSPEAANIFNPQPWPIKQYQSILREDEALVAAVPTEHGLFVWAVTRLDAFLERADLSLSDVYWLAHRVRTGVAARRSNDSLQVPPFDATASYQLYRNTLGRVEAHLRRKQHLFWYGAGPLAAIPPALLISGQPPGLAISAAGLRHLDWTIDRYTISVLPDLSMLATQRRASSRALNRKYAFLGIGAPLLVPEELEGVNVAMSERLAGGLVGRSLGELPKLPESADELRALLSLFPANQSLLLLGTAASKQAVLQALSRGAEVLSFATHGFTVGEIVGLSEPSLLLAVPPGNQDPLDAVLSSTDIVRAHIDADLVILSACNTAASDGRPLGETFSGLTSSFLSAGARTLLVSHWPVASSAATAISRRTLERSRRERITLAASLRQTMRELRDDPAGGYLHAHPFYWAPFVLVVDGAHGLE